MVDMEFITEGFRQVDTVRESFMVLIREIVHAAQRTQALVDVLESIECIETVAKPHGLALSPRCPLCGADGEYFPPTAGIDGGRTPGFYRIHSHEDDCRLAAALVPFRKKKGGNDGMD